MVIKQVNNEIEERKNNKKKEVQLARSVFNNLHLTNNYGLDERSWGGWRITRRILFFSHEDVATFKITHNTDLTNDTITFNFDNEKEYKRIKKNLEDSSLNIKIEISEGGGYY